MKFYAENELGSKTQFKGVLEFLNSDITISEDMARTNPMIKGSSRSGKTKKVLIPLYKVWSKGKLYIDFKGTFDESSVESIKVFTEASEDLIDNLSNHLLSGGAALLDLSKLRKEWHHAEISDFMDMFFETLLMVNLDEEILICIDELPSFGFMELLLSVLDSKNIRIASTLQYTRQLLTHYTHIELLAIHKKVTMYDTEKQPIG